MSRNADPYQPLVCQVAEIVDETPTIKTFVFGMETPFAFRAGQFVQLTLPGWGEAPFTPSSSPLEPERLEITLIRTGTVTNALHRLRPGERLGIRGPFGKGYPVEEHRGQDVLIVGGGCGLAPLRSLVYVLIERASEYGRIAIKYGARNPDELVYRRQYETWQQSAPNLHLDVTVDVAAAGWNGKVGLVTSLLDDPGVDLAKAVVFSCGPDVMLRFVTEKLLRLGVRAEQIYLSMNRKMSCGVGKCGRCNIGPYYLCKDGPDINYALIQSYGDVF